MMTRQLLMLPLIIFMTLFASSGAAGMSVPAQGSPTDCSGVATLASGLRSSNGDKRTRVTKAILLMSGRSESSRQCVIREMLKVAALPTTRPDKARTLFLKEPARYSEWTEAVHILGEMQATEAVDTLIDCLDCNDGKSTLGIGLFPAALSLVKFSDQAIPKLEEALRQKPPGIRIIAVQSLRTINGERAKSILSEALKTETNESVADTIKNILISLNALPPSKK